MKFYFVAVNYNSISFTKEYITSVNSIFIAEEDEVNIVIVDNNSDQNNINKLKEVESQHFNVSVIYSKVNLGYFRGLNKGIEVISDNEDSIMIIGNNDLTFDNHFIRNFKTTEYHNDVLVIAPNIITKDGRQQNPHVIKKVSKIERIKAGVYNSNYYVGQFFRFLNQYFKKIKNKPSSYTNDYGHIYIKRGIGACYILTPNFFKHYKKLDDRVFMWGEEALLSNQVETVGGKTLYAPNLRIIHHESASVVTIQSRKKYNMVKESYKVYKKYL